MRTVVKLAFFFWLAISALLVWATDRQLPSGEIALGALCILAFFGGIGGVAASIFDALYERR